jgi:NAD(P)-dependent dehydrogenase (short-subunit alcohol dehydrogenase family)
MGTAVRHQPFGALRPRSRAARRARCRNLRPHRGRQLNSTPPLPCRLRHLHFRFRPYDPLLAYGQSKTATILFAVGATARWAADGITANALNPGAIATNLQRPPIPTDFGMCRTLSRTRRELSLLAREGTNGTGAVTKFRGQAAVDGRYL